jgi:hypothetical protein
VRSIDIDRHVARVELVIDAGAGWSETYQRDLVGAF